MVRMRELVLAGALAIGLAGTAGAAEAPKPPAQSWSFEGIFGTFDRAALQRGYQVYKEVCAGCHALSQIRYRDLGGGTGAAHEPLIGLGFSEAEVKAIAAEYTVMDGPNDDGELFERPARPADRLRKPFPNEKAARAANNGAYPLDLSLIVDARHDGANYLYALLTGYADPPPGVQLGEGMHYNAWFAGNQIAMAAPLSDDRVTYADGTKATVSQMARDVTTFLAWASEPNMEARKALGVKVILFLIILTGLLYAVKRKVWSSIH
jgi:ubiquinol-cytochrome c reductase cytochrome c1 subunit